MLTAEEWIGESPFVMYLGDNFLRDGISDLVGEFQAAIEQGTNAQILLTSVPNPEQFGVALLEGDRVVRLIEKPPAPPPWVVPGK